MYGCISASQLTHDLIQYANDLFYISHTAFLTYILQYITPIFKIFSCIFVCLICMKFHPFMKRMVGWNRFLYRCIINNPCISETTLTGDSIPFQHAFQQVPYPRKCNYTDQCSPIATVNAYTCWRSY